MISIILLFSDYILKQLSTIETIVLFLILTAIKTSAIKTNFQKFGK